jgi:tetratricopeptide (TPR) repeat protein
MSSIHVFVIVFLGAGIVAFGIYIVKRLVGPKRMVALENALENGNSKLLMRHAKSLLARNERNVDAHWYLGEAYRLEERFDLAVVEYRYITNAARYTATAHERKVREALARTYLKMGQLDESQKEFILLSKLEPGNFEYIYQIAKIFEDRNFSDSAYSNYKRVIALNPKHGPSYMRLGVILYLRKQLNEAKKAFMTALRFDPQNVAPYYYLGKISRSAGDTGSALIQFEMALKDPELKQRALYERGFIFVTRGHLKQAIEELGKAACAGEEDLAATLAIHHLLAQCFEASKDIVHAVEHWEKVYEKNPKYKDVAEKLAKYSDLRTDDKLKDFLIAPQQKFQEYSARIVESMGLAVQDVFMKNQDLVELYALETQSKWRNQKKAPSIIKVIRSIDPIGYDTIRALYDQMRRMNANRSICIAASKFTRTALEFAQIRPIELIDKDELTKILQDIQM